MSSQQVLREYLLSLGFKLDETQTRKFDFAIGKLDFNALRLAKSFVGAGVAAEAMVALFSRSMEKLYYSSQRTQSTVTSINALRFAAEQVGVSGDAAQAALEGMQRTMRMNPGMRGYLDSLLGADSSKMQGVKQMFALIKDLKGKEEYEAIQVGGAFGIGPDDLSFLMKYNDELEAAFDKREQMAKAAGLDEDKAAKVGKEYMNELREVVELFGVLKNTVMVSMVGPFKEVATVVKGILRDWTQIVRTWTDLPDFAKRVVEGIAGKAGGARVNLSKDSRDRIAAGALGINFMNLPVGLRNNNPGNLMPGGVLATYSSQEEGLAAMAANLSKYGKRGWNTIESIIGHWAPRSDPRNPTDAYIKNVSAWTGFSATDPLNLNNPTVKAMLMDAMIKQEQGRNPFGFDALLGAAGGGGAKVVQSNSFSITTPDPKEAAHWVGAEMDRVNDTLARNLAGGPE